MAAQQPRPVTEQTSSMSTGSTVSYRRNGKLFSCEPCRKGKLKCDHNTPTCGRCARLGKVDICVYHPAPLTKGRDSTPVRPSNTTASNRFTPYPTHGRTNSGMISPPLDSEVERHIASTATAEAKLPPPAPFASSASTTTTSISHSPTVYSRSASTLLAGIQPSQTATDIAKSGTVAPMWPASIFNNVASSTPHSQVVSDMGTTSLSNASFVSPESCSSYIDRKHGFLGPTAFTAVFAEHCESTGFGDEDGLAMSNVEPIPAVNIERGAKVLALLRDMPWFRVFTKRYYETWDGLIIMQPVFKIWFDELWDTWGDLLVNGSQQQLLRLSELVFRNTRQSVRVNGSTRAVDWARAATGQNLRWEAVGSVLSLVTIIAINFSDWELMFDDADVMYIERADFVDRMRRASELCACFCYECEVLNDWYIAFMFQDMILLGSMKSEVHYASWQRLGEVVDSIVALGIHRGNYIDSDTPLWLSEFRRKLFVVVFARDKALASFLGRPPRLSHRYCKLEMPMELTDEDLFLEGAELEAARSKIDEHGWAKQGTLSRRSWTRVWFQEALIREDILEIALGSQDDDLDNKIEKVRVKLFNAQREFPPYMLQSPDELMKTTKFGGATRCDRSFRQTNAVFVMCINLGLKLTEFLLQRAIVNRSKGDTKTLIPISRRVLQTVLLVQTRKELFKDFRGDIIWILVSYGLATAGVLAIELLKQEQSRKYDSELLPKSETIQDLSVFIAALNDVQPGEGNYNICSQGRRALKTVLDQILTPTAPLIVNQTDNATIDENLYFPTGNDVDFLAWLDNIDWDKNFPSSQTD